MFLVNGVREKQETNKKGGRTKERKNERER
jgi:hypothetical protein